MFALHQPGGGCGCKVHCWQTEDSQSCCAVLASKTGHCCWYDTCCWGSNHGCCRSVANTVDSLHSCLCWCVQDGYQLPETTLWSTPAMGEHAESVVGNRSFEVTGISLSRDTNPEHKLSLSSGSCKSRWSLLFFWFNPDTRVFVLWLQPSPVVAGVLSC